MTNRDTNLIIAAEGAYIYTIALGLALARNALTQEWGVHGIVAKESPILTDRLHMGAFGLRIAEHKPLKAFEVPYRGRKPIFKGDLPSAMTATELAQNALASTVAHELHVSHDSHRCIQINSDVARAGRIVGDTRHQIEDAIGRPVVSSRTLLRDPDGDLWEISAAAGDTAALRSQCRL